MKNFMNSFNRNMNCKGYNYRAKLEAFKIEINKNHKHYKA